MSIKMTRDILESHLYCKYKAYLKIVGQQGTKSDYETMLVTTDQELTHRGSKRDPPHSCMIIVWAVDFSGFLTHLLMGTWRFVRKV